MLTAVSRSRPRADPRELATARRRRRLDSWTRRRAQLPAVEMESRVAVVESAEAVGDHQRRPADHQPAHRVHDPFLGSDVDRGSRLVEQRIGVSFRKARGERDALTLPS